MFYNGGSTSDANNNWWWQLLPVSHLPDQIMIKASSEKHSGVLCLFYHLKAKSEAESFHFFRECQHMSLLLSGIFSIILPGLVQDSTRFCRVGHQA